MALVVKNVPANAGDVREAGSIPGLGRSPGGGHGNPLQYSCLENPMDRGACCAIVLQRADMTEATEYVHTIRRWLPGHCLHSTCSHTLGVLPSCGGGGGGTGFLYSQGKNIKLGFGKFW